MRAKLDENLGRSCAELLAALGHDVATVHQEGMGSWKDEDVLSACARENRALITLDLDFSNPLRFPPEKTPGIVVLRLPSPIEPGHLAAALASLNSALSSRSVEGRLWIAQPGTLREWEPRES